MLGVKKKTLATLGRNSKIGFKLLVEALRSRLIRRYQAPLPLGLGRSAPRGVKTLIEALVECFLMPRLR